MNEWEDQFNPEAGETGKGVNAGGWDAGMTAAALVPVAAVSFLISFLTKDVPSRPFWLLFISFASPVAALMLAVFLKEKLFPSMTPSSSRKAQIILAACTVLAAGLVGCFCLISNGEQGEQTVIREGWSDVLIILDKSGSMMVWSESDKETLDTVATKAVTDLINQMDDKTRVGLLIDVGWQENNGPGDTIPLEKRVLPISELLPDHRKKLVEMSRCDTAVNENFPRAFQVACEMVQQYDGQDGDLSIVIISDGADCTGEFRAKDFASRLNERNVKVYYLYVAPGYSTEMRLLTEQTGGESIFVNERSVLLEQMKRMVTVPKKQIIYKDALRNIDESVTAKAVTGSLLAVLGVLIGVTLTVMFSLQGQKRFQMVLSPLAALLAFAVLAFGKEIVPVPWVREGIAFSLFGIVLMRKNGITGQNGKVRPAAADVSPDGPEDSSYNEW